MSLREKSCGGLSEKGKSKYRRSIRETLDGDKGSIRQIKQYERDAGYIRPLAGECRKEVNEGR